MLPFIETYKNVSYETNLFYKIEETKEYEKYTKLRKKEDRVKEKTIKVT